MTLDEKIEAIFNIIKTIETEDDPGVYLLMLEGFILSLNLLKELSEKGSREDIDISEQIEMVTRVLGISLKDLVLHIIGEVNEGQATNDKAVDENTLAFITSTSDLDDYEKFIAQNKAKEDLDFLSKAI
jgi:hypothetical protein